MSLMSWNANMSVGVPSVDEQHKKLVDMLNELYDGIQTKQTRETLGKVLDGLISYTVSHFRHEEQFFARTNYPDAPAHIKEHRDLTRQVLDVQKRHKAGETGTLSMEVMNFLKRWLIDHIQGSDKKYSPHMSSKGIK
jgi:hemerythrin